MFQGLEVSVDDVSRVFSLFMDEGRSADLLKEFQMEFMFNEVDSDGDKVTPVTAVESVTKMELNWISMQIVIHMHSPPLSCQNATIVNFYTFFR